MVCGFNLRRKVIGISLQTGLEDLEIHSAIKDLSLSFLIDVQKEAHSLLILLWVCWRLYANAVGSEWRDPKGVVLPEVKADGSQNTTPIGKWKFKC